MTVEESPNKAGASTNGTSKESLTITDNRTGKSYQVPIENGAIRATELTKLKLEESDLHGLVSYDPAFMNTASCSSAITYIDGDKGILLYRGYPIEQLAEKSTYMETAYLLVHGELPTKKQADDWNHEITTHTLVHENIRRFIEGFHHDAHPMGMLCSTVAAMSTFYPQAHNIHDAEQRRISIYRLIAKMPRLAALAHRHSRGLFPVYPNNDLSYPGNFLSMMFKMVEPTYRPVPEIERALDVLFILHADHEQNCSASVMRSVGSSDADPYTTTSAAIAALYGPKHGGANEQALRMLTEIGHVDRIPEYIKRVKDGEIRLMGFGHRIYKNFDPRAKIIKKIADEVFSVTGVNPLLKIALELEKIALNDEYFVSRKLYPNVDFYSGIIYQAIGIPMEMFPVMFAIPRTSGWLSQWEESLLDKESKITRPRQIYIGHSQRDYVTVDQR